LRIAKTRLFRFGRRQRGRTFKVILKIATNREELRLLKKQEPTHP
jgi:hypothetical protein